MQRKCHLAGGLQEVQGGCSWQAALSDHPHQLAFCGFPLRLVPVQTTEQHQTGLHALAAHHVEHARLPHHQLRVGQPCSCLSIRIAGTSIAVDTPVQRA